MNTNPYETPHSDVEAPVMKKGSTVKAVIIATVVDLGGTFVLSMILGVIYAIYSISQGIPPEELAASMEDIENIPVLYNSNMVIGLLVTVFAGYLCARIAKKANYRAVNIYLIVLILLINLLMLSTGEDIASTKHISQIIISILAGYLGAWLYIRNIPKEHGSA